MQELEKILEEIDERQWYRITDAGNKPLGIIDVTAVKNIIQKHMNDGWVPVDRELPPNANHKGALCPRYQVMTKYGVTEGWYNPDYESWFCLLWFMNKKFTKGYIDFERGDVPKVVQIEKGIDIVLAWRPLPEPYKPERR